MKVSACIIPDSAVLTLREEKPSADSCEGPFLEKHIEGILPVGCGAEAVFNFSWEKEIDSYGSGDDNEDQWPTTIGTTVIPASTLLSAAAHHSTTHSTTATGVATLSVKPSRSAPRLPSRFTPSSESRHSSFQHLLRIHLNTFNQRLSMLESNTLDMKESIHSVKDQQSHLSSQLTELMAMQSAGEKNKKVSELEKSYTNMDARLTRLEGRLEILIDGFTALAQELNRMKRARHVSRSPKEQRVLPSLATVLALPLYSTPQPPVRVIPTKMPFACKATVPKSIPIPGLPANKPTSASQRERKLKSAATTKPVKNTVTRASKSQVSTLSKIKLRTTLSKPMTSSKSASKTVRPKIKRPGGRRSAVTAKHVSQPSQTKPKQVKKAITKFQLEPPAYKPKPDQANKNELLPIQNNGRNKAFRSDAPVPKKVQEGAKSSEGDSKKLSHNSNQNEKKMESNSNKLVAHNTKKNSTKNAVSITKPTKATTAKKSNTTVKKTTPAKIKARTAKKSNTTVRRTTPAKTKTTAARKKSTTTVKRKVAPPKTKAITAKKVTKKKQQKKNKTNTHSSVLDLLQLLQGHHKSAKQSKNHDGSLHVVLGRLAIPIKIIPFD